MLLKKQIYFVCLDKDRFTMSKKTREGSTILPENRELVELHQKNLE